MTTITITVVIAIGVFTTTTCSLKTTRRIVKHAGVITTTAATTVDAQLAKTMMIRMNLMGNPTATIAGMISSAYAISVAVQLEKKIRTM